MGGHGNGKEWCVMKTKSTEQRKRTERDKDLISWSKKR